MRTYEMYRPPYAIVVLCLILLLIVLSMLAVSKTLLSIIGAADLLGAMAILALYVRSTYTYEVGDEGVRMKSLTRSIFIPYQEMKYVISATDAWSVPPYGDLPHKDIVKRRFIRVGLPLAKKVVVIETTKEVSLLNPIAYVLTPIDVDGLVAELRPKLNKS